MNFIVLHRASDGEAILVNLDHVIAIGTDNGRVCVCTSPNELIYVKETIPRIQWLMGDGGSCK